jgi:hypothetical protein
MYFHTYIMRKKSGWERKSGVERLGEKERERTTESETMLLSCFLCVLYVEDELLSCHLPAVFGV